MTETIQEFDISELFDDSIECDLARCESDAQWVLRRVCCKHPTLACDPCKEYCIRRVEQYKATQSHAYVPCPYCHKETPVPEAGYEVTKL